jgi:hypothetical protein
VGRFDEIRAHRFAYLKEVYDETGGSRTQFVSLKEIGDKLGFDDELTDKIVSYLVDEDLLDQVSQGFARLAHPGLKEVEEVLDTPDQATEHFPALVVAENYIRVGAMHGSQIQQGTTGSVQSQAPLDVDRLRDLVEEIRASSAALALGDDDQRELQASISTAEAQLDSSRPNRSILRESLSSTHRILESAVGSGLAAAAPHLPQLVESLSHAIASL